MTERPEIYQTNEGVMTMQRMEQAIHHMLDIACVKGDPRYTTVIERVQMLIDTANFYQTVAVSAMRRLKEVNEYMIQLTGGINMDDKQQEQKEKEDGEIKKLMLNVKVSKPTLGVIEKGKVEDGRDNSD